MPGQRDGTYQGPGQPKGTRAMCQGVPDGNNGGPPGTPKPYWKLTPAGGGPEIKYGMDGQPLAPGDMGHPQDDWGTPPPSPPEPAAPAPEPVPGLRELPEIPFIEIP